MLNDLPKAHSKCLSQDYNLYLYHSKDCIFPQYVPINYVS